MAWQANGKRPSGLDDGNSSKTAKKKERTKETKPDASKADKISKPTPTTEITTTTIDTVTSPESRPNPPKSNKPQPQLMTQAPPKILPGETLANFALRVDQTLPLSSMSRSTNANLPDDLKAKLKKSQRTTKHNKRLQKMQADWRATEAKLREKEEEDDDERDEQREEHDLLWASVRSARDMRKGKKKKRAAKGVNGGIDDDDPWKELEKRRREETKQKNLQDVVKAPPVLKKIKSKFKVRREDLDTLGGGSKGDFGGDDGFGDALVDVSNVPNAVGSLRRREELNQTRRAVIEGYRQMRGRKRGVDERLNLSRPVMT